MCVIALTVYSCSNDRDEQLNENPAEAKKTEKLELKKLKPLNRESGPTYRTSSDTVIVNPPMMSSPAPSTGIEPNDPIITNPDPNDPELIPPGDIRPPKGGK